MEPTLLDVVALREAIPEHGLSRGRTGTIVELLPSSHFDVEFVRPDRTTDAMLALNASQFLIMPLFDEARLKAERLERMRLKAAHHELFDAVRAIVNRYDPMGFLQVGAPEDEYEPEVAHLILRFKDTPSANDLCRIIREEFEEQFGQPIEGRADTCSNLAADLWEFWRALPTTQREGL